MAPLLNSDLPRRWRRFHARLDHIYIDVHDYEESKAFFSRVLAPLGIGLVLERELTAGYGRGQRPELFIRSSQAHAIDP